LRERLYPVSRYTLALTGTPLPNGYQDAYGLYSAFAPATFDVRNWTHFRARYAVRGNPRIPQQITGWNNADDIRARMTRHAISCRAADVLDLPDAIHETIWVDLDPATARGYAQMEALMVAEVAGSEVTAANALVKALRLQQIAGGVFKTDDGVEHRVGREKERALTDMLECIDRREPVVCFAQFRSDLESIHVAARAHGRPSFEVSGNVKQVQEWSAACGDGAVMAAQIAAGGLGINEFVAARF
jgi:SNF2 family DNA or RNA helicase